MIKSSKVTAAVCGFAVFLSASLFADISLFTAMEADYSPADSFSVVNWMAELDASTYFVLSDAWGLYLRGVGAVVLPGTGEAVGGTAAGTCEIDWRSGAVSVAFGGAVSDRGASPRAGVTWSPSLDLSVTVDVNADFPWDSLQPWVFGSAAGVYLGMGPSWMLRVGAGFERYSDYVLPETVTVLEGVAEATHFTRGGWTVSAAGTIRWASDDSFLQIGAEAGALGFFGDEVYGSFVLNGFLVNPVDTPSFRIVSDNRLGFDFGAFGTDFVVKIGGDIDPAGSLSDFKASVGVELALGRF